MHFDTIVKEKLYERYSKFHCCPKFLIHFYPFKLPTNNLHFQNFFTANQCDGSCGQGEGDCDWNSDCLPGLICEWDWWLGTDYCEAGRTLQNTFSDNSTKIYYKDVLQINW